MSWVLVPFVSPTQRDQEACDPSPTPNSRARFLCPFVFWETLCICLSFCKRWWVGVHISRESTDTLDTLLAQQGMVLFSQSEYSWNKIETSQLQLAAISSLIGRTKFDKLLAALKQTGIFSDPCWSFIAGRFYLKILGQVLSPNPGIRGFDF